MSLGIIFGNQILDSGIQGFLNLSGIWGALYSGGSESVNSGNYARRQITSFDLSSNLLKPASARISFAPTGVNFNYDEIRLYNLSGIGSGTLLHSVTVPLQTIVDGDIHQVLIQFSGNG